MRYKKGNMWWALVFQNIIQEEPKCISPSYDFQVFFCALISLYTYKFNKKNALSVWKLFTLAYIFTTSNVCVCVPYKSGCTEPTRRDKKLLKVNPWSFIPLSTSLLFVVLIDTEEGFLFGIRKKRYRKKKQSQHITMDENVTCAPFTPFFKASNFF